MKLPSTIQVAMYWVVMVAGILAVVGGFVLIAISVPLREERGSEDTLEYFLWGLALFAGGYFVARRAHRRLFP